MLATHLACPGACTAAFLSVVYANKQKLTTDVSWLTTLSRMRFKLVQDGFAQIPQLSSSRLINLKKPVSFVPTNSKGMKRAVLIGIEYVGQPRQLPGCHNDVLNMYSYLTNVCGFQASNITILMDDGKSTSPTRQNITTAIAKLVQSSKAGDVCVLHYSGHGEQLRSKTDPEGWDETILPVDFSTAGQIRDVELFNTFVSKMPKDVYTTCIFDSCHSGSVLNLPYMSVGDGDSRSMQLDPEFILPPTAQK
jgi:hypothetical protein